MYKSEQIIALCFKLKTLKEVLMEMILMKVNFFIFDDVDCYYQDLRMLFIRNKGASLIYDPQ